MKNIALALAIVIMAVTASFSQPKRMLYSNTIPDSLTKGACAVIRLDSTITKCQSIKQMSSRHIYIATILSKEGEKYGHFVANTKKGSTLSKFSGTLYDANGEKKRSFSKSDVKYTGISMGIADDYTTHYLELGHPTFPYTIHYEFEITWSDGFLTIPSFSPSHYTDASLERASYTLITPPDYGFSYKPVNTSIEPTVQQVKEGTATIWKMQGIRSYRNDALIPPAKDVIPHIYITPHAFIFHKESGNASTWEEYGKWQWSLIDGRDILPQNIKDLVHSITDTIPDRRNKIKALYDYLGKTTRYVSIQLGLGGLQPMSAEDVSRNGFGDCKGLSNYLKAMLAECGIESNYVETDTRYHRIHKDNTSALQTNHVILKVPDPQGDLWLECTNTSIPFGYIHDGIAGHDAVVYSNGTAHIETIPNYPDSSNSITTEVSIRINLQGHSFIKVHEKYVNQCAEKMIGLAKVGMKEKKDFILSQLDIPNCSVDSISVIEYSGQTPVIEISYICSSTNWIQTNGERMFVPQTIYRNLVPVFNRTRELPIHIKNGYTWVYNTCITLPSSCTFEAKTPDTQTECCMGNFSHKIMMNGNTIQINSKKQHLSGMYPKENIKEIKDFFRISGGTLSKKIILRRQ